MQRWNWPLIAVLLLCSTTATAADRPNILWILGEDMGPQLACYGYPNVETPNLDQFAREGVLYRRAFTTAPVCSASRSAMITGMYQTTIGAHHHRSHRGDGYTLPEPVQPITAYFREAGYHTANLRQPAPGLRVGGKTDFNFNTPGQKVFDSDSLDGGRKAQPFYAQINFFEPHRSRPPEVWSFTKNVENPVKPADVTLPPYYPDHPIVRQDWAGYLTAIQLLDQKVGQVLKHLEETGLAENTIVIFLGDNGRCHVRGKQFLYDGGIHIPLIIRIPKKYQPAGWQPGTESEELISSIDLAATSLALAGIEPPQHMQGRVFLGADRDEPRQLIFAARDRCDETVDRIRCVRSDRYKYIRNFQPERAYTQHNDYKERSYPALGVMRALNQDGKLSPEQALFMAKSRPQEELYDLEADPHELKNLAQSPEHQATLKRFRNQLETWIEETDDKGRFPEPESAIPAGDLKRIKQLKSSTSPNK